MFSYASRPKNSRKETLAYIKFKKFAQPPLSECYKFTLKSPITTEFTLALLT